MNWSLLSEKFGREEGSILIFCANEDRNDPWVINRAQGYRKDGYKVFVKTARQGGYSSHEDAPAEAVEAIEVPAEAIIEKA